MPVLFDDEPNGCIKIGLIDNMSDEALKATERQFTSLLESASGNMPIQSMNWLRPICAQKETVSKRLKAMADSEELLGAPYPPRFLLGGVG